MVEHTKTGNYRIRYLGGQIIIRPTDGSFIGRDGQTVPLSKGIVIVDGSIKSFLSFDAFSALVQAAYQDHDVMSLLKTHGVDLKKGLIG